MRPASRDALLAGGSLAWSTATAAVALALAVAASVPERADAAPPVRKSGTVKLLLDGARKATGTFPAVCGPYLMMDVAGVGKAGDGLVFEADVPGVGHLQVSSAKRAVGRSKEAGLVLNPTGGGSCVGDGAAPNEVVFGPALDTAKVRATLGSLRRKRGAPPEQVTLRADFDCSR